MNTGYFCILITVSTNYFIDYKIYLQVHCINITLRLDCARPLGVLSISPYSVGLNSSVDTSPLEINKPSSNMVITSLVTLVKAPWSVNIMLSCKSALKITGSE